VRSIGHIEMTTPPIREFEGALIAGGIAEGEAATIAAEVLTARKPAGSYRAPRGVLITWERAGRRRLYQITWLRETGQRSEARRA
jgi:hypothetical protein